THLAAGLRHPSKLREVGILRVLRRQQDDLWARVADSFAILLEPQVVEARTLQKNRTVDRRRIDRNARSTLLERGFARKLGGTRRKSGCRRGAELGLFLLLMRQGGLMCLLRLHLGTRDEVLPAEQHGGGQQHGEKEVAIFVHGAV